MPPGRHNPMSFREMVPAPTRDARHAVPWAAALPLALLACSDPGTAPRRDTTGTGSGPWWEVTDVAGAEVPTALRTMGDALYFVDGSSTPIRRVSVAGGTPVPVFTPRPIPGEIVSDGEHVFWIAGDTLSRSSPDFASTVALDVGARSSREVAGTMLLHDRHVYWITTVPTGRCSPACDFAVRRIDRAGGVASVVVEATQPIVDIAIAGDQLYWMEEGMDATDATRGSAIRRRALSGGAVTTVVNGRLNGRIVPPPGQGVASWHPRGGLEADGAHVYFADATFSGRYRVMRVPVDSGDVEVLADNEGLQAIDLLLDGAALYWADGTAVRRMATTGGTQATLATSTTGVTDLVRLGGSLFWLEAPGGAQPATLRSVATTGGAPVVVRANAGAASRLAVDAARLWWVEAAPIPGFGRIGSMTHAGADARTMMEAGSGGGFDLDGGPFDVDETHVYFADRFTVKRASIATGAVERVAVGSFFVQSLATDATHVYWVERSMAVVRRVPKAGGVVETIGTGNGMPGALRLDATHAWWMDASAGIRRVPKTGGTPTTVLATTDLLTDFVVAGGFVIAAEWDGGRILRIPVEGGTPVTLASPGGDQTRRLAANATHVYWAGQAEVGRVAIAGGTPEVVTTSPDGDPFVAAGIVTRGGTVYWTAARRGTIRRASPIATGGARGQ